MAEIIKPLLVVLLLAAVAFVLFRESSRSDAMRRKRFDTRSPVSEHDFLLECEAQDVNLALSLRRKIADVLGVPAEKLKSSDRFDHELKPPHGWEHDDGVNVLMLELQAALHAKHLSADTKEIQSVRDYVTMWTRVQAHKAPGSN